MLEGALAIGRQADTLGPDEVRTRMEVVQGRATTATSVAQKPLLSKVKSWFGVEKQTEPAV